jgi:hypothetical protein
MWDFCTESSADGMYTVRVPEGNFYLDAGAGTSYIVEWWAESSSVRNCADARQIIASEGHSISGKNFQLEVGVILSGTIFSDNGVTPITGDTTIGVGVVRDNPCESQGAAYSMPINENDGTYELLVEPGTYYLQVWADNYIDEWWHSSASVYSCSESQQLIVNAGDSINNKNFQLESGAIISGTVYKGNNSQPFVNQDMLSVEITTALPCNYNYNGPIFSTFVDTANATYAVHVPAGTYYLILNTGNHFTNEWWALPYSVSTTNCDQAQSLTVDTSNTYPNINFQFGSGFTWNIFFPAILSKQNQGL